MQSQRSFRRQPEWAYRSPGGDGASGQDHQRMEKPPPRRTGLVTACPLFQGATNARDVPLIGPRRRLTDRNTIANSTMPAGCAKGDCRDPGDRLGRRSQRASRCPSPKGGGACTRPCRLAPESFPARTISRALAREPIQLALKTLAGGTDPRIPNSCDSLSPRGSMPLGWRVTNSVGQPGVTTSGDVTPDTRTASAKSDLRKEAR